MWAPLGSTWSIPPGTDKIKAMTLQAILVGGTIQAVLGHSGTITAVIKDSLDRWVLQNSKSASKFMEDAQMSTTGGLVPQEFHDKWKVYKSNHKAELKDIWYVAHNLAVDELNQWASRMRREENTKTAQLVLKNMNTIVFENDCFEVQHELGPFHTLSDKTWLQHRIRALEAKYGPMVPGKTYSAIHLNEVGDMEVELGDGIGGPITITGHLRYWQSLANASSAASSANASSTTSGNITMPLTSGNTGGGTSAKDKKKFRQKLKKKWVRMVAGVCVKKCLKSLTKCLG